MVKSKKPKGYWDNFQNVEQELCKFISQHGVVGRMPTVNNLVLNKHSDLYNAILKHGGLVMVAEKLNLLYEGRKRGYWDIFANLQHEIDIFIAQHGTPGHMPTVKSLKAAKRQDLLAAIAKHGGLSMVAEKLNLKCHRREKGYWDDFADFKEELYAFIAEYGTPGYMPRFKDIKAAGRGDLCNAIARHGGITSVAGRLGLKARTYANCEAPILQNDEIFLQANYADPI